MLRPVTSLRSQINVRQVRRAFSSSKNMMAVKSVDPAAAYQALSEGNGVLVDIRPTSNGITINNAIPFSADAILGPIGGLNTIPEGSVDRAEMIESVSKEALGLEQYHEIGNQALESIREGLGDKKLTHAQAREHIQKRLTQLKNPGEAIKTAIKDETQSIKTRADALKSAIKSGKATAAQERQVTEAREKFSQFLNGPGQEHSRFTAKQNDAKALAQKTLDEGVVREVNNITGKSFGVRETQDFLKKKVSSAQLKDNKSFVEFYSEWLVQSQTKRLESVSSTITSLGQDTTTQEQIESRVKARWNDYLSYKENPSKEDLIAFFNVSDKELAWKAGHSSANIGPLRVKRAEEQAKEALNALPKERPLYLIDTAEVYARRAAEALSKAGAGDVRVVAGGFDRWLVQSLPTALSSQLNDTVQQALTQKFAKARAEVGDINE